MISSKINCVGLVRSLNSKDKLYCYGKKGLKIMENELNKREIIKNNMNI